MQHVVSPKRSAWEDRFRAPTLAILRSESIKDITALFDEAHERLQRLSGLSESLGWHGVPWRWSLIYRHEDSPDRPWAYLVPQPNKPKIALTLDHDQVAALPIKKFTRFVREGLLRSIDVAGVRWVQWELISRPQIDEIMAVVECKHGLTPAKA